MRLLLPALLLLAACQKQTPAPAAPAPAPVPAPAPAPEAKPEPRAAPAPEAKPKEQTITMVEVMKDKLSPFAKGDSTDEEAFRYALMQLRELAPPDSSYNAGQRPWFQIVDDMLSNRDYRRGCQECHKLYKKDYENNYGDGSVVWVDPPKGAR